jgi:hypothetical protein
VSNRSPKAPTPAMALTVARAAAALDMSEDHFREHVAPELRWIRRGRKRVAVGQLLPPTGPEHSGPYPLIDSDWEFVVQCQRLIAHKTYENGGA